MTTRPSPFRGLTQRPALLLWALYVFLIPFYVFNSGLPQPSDFLLLIVIPLSMYRWSGKLLRGTMPVIRILVWFTLWTALVNYGWAFFTGRWTAFNDYMVYPLFYAFNVGVFYAGSILYQRYRDQFLRLTVYAIFASVMVQVAASFLIRSVLLRGALFFNNPNQLGYYALIAATMIAIANRRLRFSGLLVGIGFTGCAYLALISASRAALGGIGVLVVMLVFSDLRVILLSTIAAIALVSVGGPVAKAIDASELRALQDKRNGRTFAEDRGYDRVWRFKEYLVVGAGEGDFARFDRADRAHELHSSFATVLFSYGIVGTLLFVLFAVGVVRGSTFRAAAMLGPIGLYMAAHQGLRFTLVWVLLAVFFSLRDPGLDTAVVPATR